MASFISWGNQFYTIIRTQLKLFKKTTDYTGKYMIEPFAK